MKRKAKIGGPAACLAVAACFAMGSTLAAEPPDMTPAPPADQPVELHLGRGWTLRPEILYTRDESNDPWASSASTEFWVALRRGF